MSYLSENIAALLEQREMNATNLAEATGVPQPTIHRILKGTSKDPRTTTIQPIADYFGVPVDTLRSAYVAPALRVPSKQQEINPFERSRERHRIQDSTPRERRQLFMKELADQLGYRLDPRQPDPLHSQPRKRFDYASEKVIAKFLTVQVRQATFHSDLKYMEPDGSSPLVLSTQEAETWLWQMSCTKLMVESIAPTRQYFLFVDTFLLSPTVSTQRAAQSISRLMSDANLHGLQVVWCGPIDAANTVVAAERGEYLPFYDVDEEEEANKYEDYGTFGTASDETD